VAAPPGPSGSSRTTANQPGTRSSSDAPASELAGLASYYAEPYHGRKTANGETFDTYEDLTAAHRTLPFNTVVKVTNENNGRDVEVRINDRGPFIDGRIIDLSLKAAREIDMVRAGVVPVKLDILKEGLPTPRGTARSAGPPAPSAAAIYTIQVGAFETQDAAESLQRELEKRYRDVTVQTVSMPRTFYRVRVGRAADLLSAEKLSKQLREESYDPFVVRLN
jgi:rare lipoprotein A